MPIFLLCAANVGSSMATAFRFIYSRICCGYCNYIKLRRLKLRLLNYTNSAYTQTSTPTFANYEKNDGASNRIRLHDYENDSMRLAQMNEINKYVIEASINQETNYKKITVPISVTILVLGTYIIIGAFLFSLWENWTFLEGAYFSFITMSTIGLGDYVPGNSINDTQSQEKLALCSLYLILGLFLIGMCFDLMQEEVTAKCQRLATKLGFYD
jgi:potassium channel subfamily K protein